MARLIHTVALNLEDAEHYSAAILCVCGEIFEHMTAPLFEPALLQMSLHLKEMNEDEDDLDISGLLNEHVPMHSTSGKFVVAGCSGCDWVPNKGVEDTWAEYADHIESLLLEDS